MRARVSSSALVFTLTLLTGAARADAPPRLVSAPEVTAPADAPENASVVLRITVDATGAVTDVEVVEGVRADIDAMATDAARQMRFTPAERGGQAVPARLRFRFRLHDASASSSPPPDVTSSSSPPPESSAAPVPASSSSSSPQPSVSSEAPELNRITVRGHYEPGAATRLTFRAEELTTVPGTFGEPLRVVASQPGVARTPFGLGFFVVRGASFENTGFYIDGFPVLILYHLAAGPSVISSRLVGQLDFYPGGYPLQFGRFSAGIISLETRAPPADRPRAEAEIDVFRASLLGVMPFSNGRGSVAIAARRSYYDLFLPLIQPGVSVNYGDAQLRADYHFTDRLHASLFAFVSNDGLTRTQVEGTGATAATATDAASYLFYRAIGKLEWNGPRGIYAQTSAMVGYDETRLSQSDPGQPDRVLAAAGSVLGERASVRIPLTPAFTTTIGIDVLSYLYSVNLAYPSPAGFSSVPPPLSNPRIANIISSVDQFGVAGYVESTLRAGRFEFTAGPRVEYMRWGSQAHVVFDPRAVARLRVIDPLMLVVSTGLFHQPPPVFALVPQAGNPNLLPQAAWQSSAGFEATLPLHFTLRMTGFYNRMWQLPRATYEIINTPSGPQRALAVSDGQGQAYGLEVQLRRQLTTGVYGWLSYTLSRSERWVEDPVTHQVIGRVVPFTYDQTHVLNLAVSWDITRQWRVGARFQLATGSPTSLVTGAIYDADSDRYRPQYLPEADRLPAYHQLDVRVDYKFRFWRLDMAAFLDVLNIYNAQNSEGWIYQYDYSARAPRPGLPILPAIGIRGEL